MIQADGKTNSDTVKVDSIHSYTDAGKTYNSIDQDFTVTTHKNMGAGDKQTPTTVTVGSESTFEAQNLTVQGFKQLTNTTQEVEQTAGASTVGETSDDRYLHRLTHLEEKATAQFFNHGDVKVAGTTTVAGSGDQLINSGHLTTKDLTVTNPKGSWDNESSKTTDSEYINTGTTEVKGNVMINADEMDNGNSMVTNKGTLSADKIEVGKYGTYKQEGLDALTHVDEVVLNKSSDFVIAGNVNAGNKTLIDESLAFVNGGTFTVGGDHNEVLIGQDSNEEWVITSKKKGPDSDGNADPSSIFEINGNQSKVIVADGKSAQVGTLNISGEKNLLKVGKTLDVEGKLTLEGNNNKIVVSDMKVSESENYGIEIKDASSKDDRTLSEADRNVIEVANDFTGGKTTVGNWGEIKVGGDATFTDVTMRQDSNIDVAGNVVLKGQLRLYEGSSLIAGTSFTANDQVYVTKATLEVTQGDATYNDGLDLSEGTVNVLNGVLTVKKDQGVMGFNTNLKKSTITVAKEKATAADITAFFDTDLKMSDNNQPTGASTITVKNGSMQVTGDALLKDAAQVINILDGNALFEEALEMSDGSTITLTKGDLKVGGLATLNGASNVIDKGNAIYNDGLDLTDGDVTLGNGALSVKGDTSLKNGSNITVSNAEPTGTNYTADFDGALNMTGTASAIKVNNGAMRVRNSAILKDAAQEINILDGNADFLSALTMGDGSKITLTKGDLYVGWQATLSGASNMITEGDAIYNAGLDLTDGDVTLGNGTLKVNGVTSLKDGSNITVSNAEATVTDLTAYFDGALNMTGTASAINVNNGAMKVTGDASLTGAAHTIEVVKGIVEFGQALTMAGGSTLTLGDGNLIVKGAASLTGATNTITSGNGNLFVNGSTTMTNASTVNVVNGGDVLSKLPAIFNGELTMSGESSITADSVIVNANKETGTIAVVEAFIKANEVLLVAETVTLNDARQSVDDVLGDVLVQATNLNVTDTTLTLEAGSQLTNLYLGDNAHVTSDVLTALDTVTVSGISANWMIGNPMTVKTMMFDAEKDLNLTSSVQEGLSALKIENALDLNESWLALSKIYADVKLEGNTLNGYLSISDGAIFDASYLTAAEVLSYKDYFTQKGYEANEVLAFGDALTITNGALTLASDQLMVIDAQNVKNTNDLLVDGIINDGSIMLASAAVDKATMVVESLQVGDTIKLSDDALTNVNVISADKLIDLGLNEEADMTFMMAPTTTTYEATLKDVNSVYEGTALVNTITDVWTAKTNDENSSNAMIAFLTKLNNERVYGVTSAEATSIMNDAASIGQDAGLHLGVWAADNLMADAMVQRVEGVIPAGESSVWAQALYGHHEVEGLMGNRVGNGVDLDMSGVVVGADHIVGQLGEGDMMLGAAMGYVDADSDSTATTGKTSNRADMFNARLYMGWRNTDWSVVGDMGYTMGDNAIKQAFNLESFEANADSNALSVGVRAQYDFEVAGMNLAAHAGYRFAHITVDDFMTTNQAGQLGMYVDMDSANVHMLPIGVTISKDFGYASGWTMTPSFDLTITPTFGDDSVQNRVQVGAAQADVMELGILGGTTYAGQFGFMAQKDDVSVGFNVGALTGGDNKAWNTQLSVRYAF